MDDVLLEFAAELRESYRALRPIVLVWQLQPIASSAWHRILSHLKAAKGGATYVQMVRIEQLANAAGQALNDIHYWRLEADAPQIALIIAVLERINAIAAAIELGIGHSALGEDALIAELLGRPAEGMEAAHSNAVQIASIRVPILKLQAVVLKAHMLTNELAQLGAVPSASALALLRNDMAAHCEQLQALMPECLQSFAFAR